MTHCTKVQPPKRSRICGTCKHRGEVFLLDGEPHHHCQHPDYRARRAAGEKITAWETLMETSESCGNHEYKSGPESENKI
jgi:hypothetical protein